MSHPKLTIVDRPSKDNPEVGTLKIIYYSRLIKKYVWVSSRYGKRKSKDKAREILTQKREVLISKLTYDGDDPVDV
jgi:hypothetical protein